jgi:hypothetical protein
MKPLKDILEDYTSHVKKNIAEHPEILKAIDGKKVVCSGCWQQRLERNVLLFGTEKDRQYFCKRCRIDRGLEEFQTPAEIAAKTAVKPIPPTDKSVGILGVIL